MDIREYIISRMKEVRIKNNIKQDEMSKLIGKNENYIKNMEELKYKREPTVYVAVKFFALFDIEFSEIINDYDELIKKERKY